MKSIIIEEYGSVEQFKMAEGNTPEPKGNEVLIEVAAVAVNPVDWKIRAGYLKDWMPLKLPIVFGWDVSGTIKGIGENVMDFSVGDEVLARADLFKPGGFAEYIVVVLCNS